MDQIIINQNFVLEIICLVLGILSVWFARKENILVYPTGLISTVITVYLLYNSKDLGNMLVNVYFSVMSIYGWYNWKYGKSNQSNELSISITNTKEKLLGLAITSFTFILILVIYKYLNYPIGKDTFLDIFTTSIFFTAMWFMAKKKLESWILWIIGNILVVPLYFYKDLYLLAFQYIILTILAVLAFKDWRNSLKESTN